MATCSPEYLALVRTRGGLTPEKPWSVFLGVDQPSSSEYSEWRALAVELSAEAHRRFAMLGDVELRLNETDPTHGFEQWNRYVKQIGEGQPNSLPTRVDELPTSLVAVLDPTEMDLIPMTDRAIGLAVESACMLEELDRAIEGYGVTPPANGVSPKRASDSSGPGVLATIGFLTITGAAIGGAVWLSRRE